jgi:hypothetical protein
MKPPLSTFLSVVTLSAVLTGCTSSDSGPVVGYRERLLELPIERPSLFGPADAWTVYFERGDSRDAVLTACGRPDAVINANLWVYRNSHSPSEAAQKSDCDTLLVAFTDDRVSELKLVNFEVLQSELAKKRGHVAPVVIRSF